MNSPPSATNIPAQIWEQLLKTALLGSERAPLPSLNTDSAVPLAGLLAQVKAEDREAALLNAAALVATYDRCGIVAEQAGELSLTACPADELPRGGPSSAAYLRRILGGQFPFLLSEFLEALRLAGKRVPEELLSDLLEAARKDSSQRVAVAAVIGRRGEWLAALNPDWNFIAAELAPGDWETGTRTGRAALLRRLRHSDPKQAVALVQSTWSSDAPEDRAAFVAELEYGLSPEDESFLETALDDRRKEVRRLACELLMRLPQSALVERMWKRVQSLVRLEKSSGLKLKRLLGKQSLEIELPEVCDDAMGRDGLELKPPQGIGEKAWWLQQMVSAIPPARWETHFQLSPEQCVAAANVSEFNSVLLPGIAEAVNRYKDPRWAKPMAEIAMVHARITDPVPVATKPWDRLLEVASAMNEADRDAVIMKQLNHHGDMTDVALGLKLLNRCPGPWSPALARCFLNLLRYITRQTDPGKHQVLWSALGDLTEMSTRLPISLAEEAEQGWPEDASTKIFFKPIQTILYIFQFRSRMLKEINE